MFRNCVNPSVLSDPGWWQWTATVALLAAHLAGTPGAIYAAIALCAVMTGYYLVRLGRVRPYPVQIRLAYLGMLVAGLVPAMAWLYWVQLIGTAARVAVGYCLTGRLLSLAPWNREGAWRPALVRQALFAPVNGGLIQWGSQDAAAGGASCSLRGPSCSIRRKAATGSSSP